MKLLYYIPFVLTIFTRNKVLRTYRIKELITSYQIKLSYVVVIILRISNKKFKKFKKIRSGIFDNLKRG